MGEVEKQIIQQQLEVISTIGYLSIASTFLYLFQIWTKETNYLTKDGGETSLFGISINRKDFPLVYTIAQIALSIYYSRTLLTIYSITQKVNSLDKSSRNQYFLINDIRLMITHDSSLFNPFYHLDGLPTFLQTQYNYISIIFISIGLGIPYINLFYNSVFSIFNEFSERAAWITKQYIALIPYTYILFCINLVIKSIAQQLKIENPYSFAFAISLFIFLGILAILLLLIFMAWWAKGVFGGNNKPKVKK